MYFANSQKFSKLFDHPNKNVIRCRITQRVQDTKFHVTVLLVSKSNLSSIIPFVLSKKSPHYILLKFEEKNVMIHFRQSLYYTFFKKLKLFCGLPPEWLNFPISKNTKGCLSLVKSKIFYFNASLNF